MKKSVSLLLILALLINCMVLFSAEGVAANDSITFNIDTSNATETTVNKLTGYMNVWGYDGLKNAESDGEADISFVDYIELMTATGGSAERDLIDENGNMIESKLDSLAQACQGVLNLGAKPLIKLGCIPFYFTMKQNPEKKLGTVFGFNVFPPDDDMYGEYETYLENVLQYLINRFGIDEVRSWRFGVMTEYENADWFYVLDSSGKINANLTMTAFFKIYDYSVKALENKLGKENVYVGAHSMTVTEGLWDERKFIDHVASGYNYAENANTGVQLDYLSASFYDTKPGTYTSGKTLGECFSFLREYAESKGLYNLDYGVDEGRIYGGVNVGADSEQLNSRCVGHMWQAAYDARMYKTMLDNEIDYFSVWTWTSDTTIGKGYPTISYHVADVMNKLSGGKRINVNKSNTVLSSGVEAEAVAAYDEAEGKLGIVAYNYKNDVSYDSSLNCNFKISAPCFAGQKVLVNCYSIDYDCNYFDEWWSDRSLYGITDDKFSWSPDDPTIDSSTTLKDAKSREIYNNLLRDKYVEASKLTPSYTVVTFDDNGNAELNCSDLIGNGVVYYELTKADELNVALAEAAKLNETDYDDFSSVKALINEAQSSELSSEQRNDLAKRLNEEMGLLVNKHRTPTGISSNESKTSYDYVTLNAFLKMNKADVYSSMSCQAKSDSGSIAYPLEGNDTYDSNGFHMWCRTYQNDTSPSAQYYVDRYSYSNLSELGNIVEGDFTTWGLNHHHSIGISDTSAKMTDGSNNSVTVNGSMGNSYTYSLGNFSAGSAYSAGTATDFVHTPNGETVNSSNSASIIGAVPQSGESVKFRVGARISAIDAYGWNNLFHYYLWTDVTVTGYDTTLLREEIHNRVAEEELYTAQSYARYEAALKKSVNVVNTSYSQAEIDSALGELRQSKENLIKISDILYGDANLDGKIDGMDATVVNCVIAGMLNGDNMPEKGYIACDFDRDGAITSKDSEMIADFGLKQA